MTFVYALRSCLNYAIPTFDANFPTKIILHEQALTHRMDNAYPFHWQLI